MISFQVGHRTNVNVPEWFPGAFEGLGGRLRRAREDKGLSQYDIAKEVGLNRPQVSRYENGHNIPTVLVLAAIAAYLEVSLDWVVTGR
jgi:transcriptional regulator with XRE-family HTH domain